MLFQSFSFFNLTHLFDSGNLSSSFWQHHD